MRGHRARRHPRHLGPSRPGPRFPRRRPRHAGHGPAFGRERVVVAPLVSARLAEGDARTGRRPGVGRPLWRPGIIAAAAGRRADGGAAARRRRVGHGWLGCSSLGLPDGCFSDAQRDAPIACASWTTRAAVGPRGRRGTARITSAGANAPHGGALHAWARALAGHTSRVLRCPATTPSGSVCFLVAYRPLARRTRLGFLGPSSSCGATHEVSLQSRHLQHRR